MKKHVNFEDFISECLCPDPYLRGGQKLMIRLREHRGDLYDQIIDVDHHFDCFYEDSKMWATIQWLRDNW